MTIFERLIGSVYFFSKRIFQNYNAEYENAGQSEDSIASSSLSSGVSSGSTGSNSGGNGARPSVIVWNHAR